MQETDVVIVGAGPVGLFAVFELGLLDIKAHVVDTLGKPGGQCMELYPQKPIYDIPGFPCITGEELTHNLLEQIKPFAPVFHLHQTVATFQTLPEGGFEVGLDGGEFLRAKAVVVAAGGGNFEPKRPMIRELPAFEEQGVLYAVRDKEALARKRLLIAGGGDSAMDWVLALHDQSAVTLVHRSPTFRCAPRSLEAVQNLIESGTIRFVAGEVKHLEGEGGVLKRALIKVAGKEEMQPVDVDFFLPFFGLTMKPGPLPTFGIPMEGNLIPVDVSTFETGLPGVFAIGDINTYPGKLKLILSGFHEAALMAQKAFTYVHPDKRNVFRYTTASSDLHKKLGVL